MPKSTTFDNDLLKLILTAVAISGIADNAASSPLTNLYIALHTADPGVGGSQTTSEIAYTGYARITLARVAGSWSITGNVATLAANQFWPEMTGGTGGTASFFSIGTVLSGTGKILYSGTLTPNISVATGVTPFLKNTTTVTEN